MCVLYKKSYECDSVFCADGHGLLLLLLSPLAFLISNILVEQDREEGDAGALHTLSVRAISRDDDGDRKWGKLERSSHRCILLLATLICKENCDQRLCALVYTFYLLVLYGRVVFRSLYAFGALKSYAGKEMVFICTISLGASFGLSKSIYRVKACLDVK